MPLRKSKIDGAVVCEIPDDDWKCPKCGGGVGEGLTHEEMVEHYPDTEWMHEEDFVQCYCTIDGDGRENGGPECGWAGDVIDVYNAAMDRLNQVQCPCCRGKGTIDKDTPPSLWMKEGLTVQQQVAMKDAMQLVRRLAGYKTDGRPQSAYHAILAVGEEIAQADLIVRHMDDE